MIERPLRIAYLEATGQMGGAEHVLMALLERLPRERIEPYLVCSQSGGLAAEAHARQIPVIVEPLPTFASISRVWGARKVLNPFAVLYDFLLVLSASIRLAHRLKQLRVDLVHTNTFFANLYGGLAARHLRVPCIWQVHDVIETDRFFGLAGLGWKYLGTSLATFLVGDSKHAIRMFTASGKAMTIYAGVEPTYIPRKDWGGWRQQLGLDNKSVLVGYLGRIGWMKGLDILVEAAKRVVDQGSRIHFVIVGVPLFGETAYAEQINKRVSRLGLSDHWHYMGFCPDPTQRLHDFDCMVLPSRRESLPRVLLEAGIAGKAVVASRVGGVPEVIEDGVNGVLVPPEDSDALAQALLSLLTNMNLAREMGARAHTRIVADFDIRNSVNALVDLYQDLLNAPGTSLRS